MEDVSPPEEPCLQEYVCHEKQVDEVFTVPHIFQAESVESELNARLRVDCQVANLAQIPA